VCALRPIRWVFVNRNGLKTLSRVRIAEAKALLSQGFPDGAYYLAGYAVECALKACIAKETRRYEFPDRAKAEKSYSHNLRDLVKVANLEAARLEHANHDPDFGRYWDLAQLWSEQSRYRRHSAEVSQAMVEAVDNENHGVMAWIKRHW